MIKRLILIAAITVLTVSAFHRNESSSHLEKETMNSTQLESIAAPEIESAQQQLEIKPDKIVYHLEQRQFDETVYDDELMERVLWNIEHVPEDSPGTPSVEDELYREWLKQTAKIGIKSLDNDKIDKLINNYLRQYGIKNTIPKSITYHDGYPFIKYYEDDTSGKFAFVAAIPDYEEPYTELYLGVAYMDDLKKEGSFAYATDPEGKHLSEVFYNNQGQKEAHISYRYNRNVPFPIIIKYDSSEDDTGGFYSEPYLNIGQRFWVYDSSIEWDENGRWNKYNGNIFADSYFDSEIEGYNIPVFNKEGYIEKIVETMRGSQYQDNPEEWIEDGTIYFEYSDTGKLAEINYGGFSGTHGSSGNTGTVSYDENGRVVHIESFHSSGDYHYFYLYQGMEKYPFAIFTFGGIPYSHDEFDGSYMTFGMNFDAWILLNE